MTAHDVAIESWFMTRDKKWYKKTYEDEKHVYGAQIGVRGTVKINPNEEVMVRT